METTKLLDERNKTHGSFIVNSAVSQAIKLLLRGELSPEQLLETQEHFHKGYSTLGLIHKEALDHVCGKLGRIYAGQPTFDDHWDDCSGYFKLPVKFNHGAVEQTYFSTEERHINKHDIVPGGIVNYNK